MIDIRVTVPDALNLLARWRDCAALFPMPRAEKQQQQQRQTQAHRLQGRIPAQACRDDQSMFHTQWCD
jgi:hypothetical protein